MRLDRSWVVAKKDLAEFRKNKYIMMSLLVMPIVVSVVLPAVYAMPINELGRQNAQKVTLDLVLLRSYSDATLENMTITDAELDRVNLTNCVVSGCVIKDSVIKKSVVTSSQIERSTVGDCLVYGSKLLDVDDGGGNTVRDSEFVGGNEELEQLKDIMFNVLLILLIMIPVTIPTVTASYSFVGEKVNKSLEPLLATPITDIELLVGKAASIFLLSMSATYLSFAVSTVVIDLMTEPVLGYYPLPTPYWIAGMLLLAPGMCLMSILTNVLISSKVNDVRVSQQIGGVLVLPILLFFVFSLTGVLSTGLLPMVVFSLAVLGVDAVILMLSLKVFRREEILVSWK